MKLRLVYIALFCFVTSINAQVEAVMSLKGFYAPGAGNYLECYLSVGGGSVSYKPNEKRALQARLEITQIVKSPSDSIIAFKKFELKSPELSKDSIAIDFIDQQRFPLSAGNYKFEIEIKDLNADPIVGVIAEDKIELRYNADDLFLSDIQFIESFTKTDVSGPLTKSGYNLVAYANNFYHGGIGKIAFYTEVYNSNLKPENERLFLFMMVEEKLSGRVIEKLSKFQKKTASEVIPILHMFDIEDLPTGEYNLVIQVKNSENKLIAENKAYFYRNNPWNTLSDEELKQIRIAETFVANLKGGDTLVNYIKSLTPLASPAEIEYIHRKAVNVDDDLNRSFFYTFWKQRDFAEPEKAWLNYYEQVQYVDKVFGTRVKRGFETDRGRIYLRYGAPNTIVDRPNEPSAYPYQIWHYYKIAQFNNKRFVFYNPDLVSNDYEILHSDLLGERQNYRWEYELNRRNTPGGNIDSRNESHFENYGGQSQEFYALPR
jgi:GWxTD domain-containing protein